MYMLLHVQCTYLHDIYMMLIIRIHHFILLEMFPGKVKVNIFIVTGGYMCYTGYQIGHGMVRGTLTEICSVILVCVRSIHHPRVMCAVNSLSDERHFQRTGSTPDLELNNCKDVSHNHRYISMCLQLESYSA